MAMAVQTALSLQDYIRRVLGVRVSALDHRHDRAPSAIATLQIESVEYIH